jgi:membrane-associated protein
MEFLKYIEIILHLDKYLSYFIGTYNGWFYIILFLVIFLETGIVVTPFLPGDSLLFACGAFSAMGILSTVKTFIIIFIAAVLGDGANYHIGKFLGVKAFEKYPKIFKKNYIEKTHSFYEKYGAKTIVIARFVPIVRTFAPFMAGLGYMSYKRFVIYNITGAFLWCVVVFLGGYFFGNIHFIKNNFSYVIISIIVISILPIVYEYLKKVKPET